MTDTKGIKRLVLRATRRLRFQAGVDGLALAGLPVTLAAALVLLCMRLQVLSETAGVWMIGALSLVPLVLAGLKMAQPFPTHVVATRIDRASGLEDRLASACDFAERLESEPALEFETAELMRAAITDAETVLPKADIKKAAPWSRPRGLYPALGGVFVFVLISLWDFPALSQTVGPRPRPPVGDRPNESVEFDEDDIQYQIDVIKDMRRLAEESGDEELKKFADKLAEIVARAQKGLLTKQQMLAELARAEEAYQNASDAELKHGLDELKKTGTELAKNQALKDLGQALTQSDMPRANQALEKIAGQIENQAIKPDDQKKMAEALEKAADAYERRKQSQDEAAEKQETEKKDEIEKLKDKLEKAADKDKERLSQELERKKKELEKLEDQQEKTAQARRRHLEQLHKDLRTAGEKLKQPGSEESRRQASQAMRDIQRSTGKVDQDQRKVANQKRVASQLSDLREAMRRAKRKQGGNQPDQFGKNNQQKQDFADRAAGGQKRSASQQASGKPGQKGNQPGDGAGDEPGGSLLADPTKASGNTQDVDVQGVHTDEGTSVKETIQSAQEKGFASQSYKRVFTRYEPMVEEVINAENVPSGYKYYVKKYFQQIKPQE
jgi:hypothetical protein